MTVSSHSPAVSERADAEALDRADPLASHRDRFHVPEGLIYLDGNSLGVLAHSVRERVRAVTEREWGEGLIGSWNTAGWIDLPMTVGAKIARLIGAPGDSVVATDSTSVNLFKVLAAALAMRPDRRVIVSERANFPTDLYMAEGLAALLGKGHELRLIDGPDEVEAALGDDVAALMLTHVNYRTGRIHDMARLTELAHRQGALTIWDLAHSAGAVPVDLAASRADFAIGCGYKYLNGGPGAPGFIYVRPDLADAAEPALSGWLGHRAPFDFDLNYTPGRGIERMRVGTPPVLQMAALQEAL